MGQGIYGIESVWNKGTIDFFNQVVRATLDLVMNALLALQKLPYLASTFDVLSLTTAHAPYESYSATTAT